MSVNEEQTYNELETDEVIGKLERTLEAVLGMCTDSQIASFVDAGIDLKPFLHVKCVFNHYADKWR